MGIRTLAAVAMTKDPLTGGEMAVSLPIVVRQSSGPRLIGSGDCNGVSDGPVGGGTGPAAGTTPAPGAGLRSNRRCTTRRRFKIHLRSPKGQRLAGARVYDNGKRTRVLRRRGRLHAVVDLRKLKKGRYTVKIVALTSQGRQVVSQCRYRTCTPKRR